MKQSSLFAIRNDSQAPLFIQLEPEAHCISIDPDENVTVRDAYTEAPATLAITALDGGQIVVSVWPGDGDVIVAKDGVDVLEMTPTPPFAER
jgi:predicted methyltransferase